MESGDDCDCDCGDSNSTSSSESSYDSPDDSDSDPRWSEDDCDHKVPVIIKPPKNIVWSSTTWRSSKSPTYSPTEWRSVRTTKRPTKTPTRDPAPEPTPEPTTPSPTSCGYDRKWWFNDEKCTNYPDGDGDVGEFNTMQECCHDNFGPNQPCAYEDICNNVNPTKRPTPRPTRYPRKNPTRYPTKNPTKYGTKRPTNHPSKRVSFFFLIALVSRMTSTIFSYI